MGSHQDSPEEIESQKRHSVQDFKCLVNLIHNGTNTLLIDLNEAVGLVLTRNIYIKNFALEF